MTFSGMIASAVTRAVHGATPDNTMSSLAECAAPLMDGTSKAMGDFQGKVVVVVNVASF
jgi:hypothetical protein